MASTQTTVRKARRRENVAMAVHMVEVRASRRISPQMVRITLTGPTLVDFVNDGPDQRCKLFLPRAGQRSPAQLAAADWYQAWRELPDDVRPVLRTYIIRHSRPDLAEVDIDFVLHDNYGPAASWAARARVGDQVTLYGPRAEYAPAPGSDWRLIIGDSSALPAIAAIVESLPVTARATVMIEVDTPAEEITMASCADVSVNWVHLNGLAPGRTSLLMDGLRSSALPTGRPAVWIAGEAAMVRSIRRHLVCERGIPAGDVQFMGYWRLGASIDPE
ncbi:MAG: siderophore-interacting protein [Pseudonocardiales bacterium]|nr:siderophore-interacting protein [Pseudonocardiales bacterium]